MSASRRDKQNITVLREFLSIQFPIAFPKTVEQRRPLKIGIDRDIAGEVPNIPPKILKMFLWSYTRNPAYTAAVIVGIPRVDLQGNEVADIFPSKMEGQ
jgi:sRNA-binding protein